MEREIVAAVYKFVEGCEYPRAPFHPPVKYVEFEGLDYIETDSDNKVYSAVRELLFGLGLDKENYGKKEWNPFGEYVKNGQNILIKPNLVTHYHVKGTEGLFWSISNPSIIRVVIDYCIKAIGKTGKIGKIVIGDTPIESCKFDVLTEVIGLKELIKYYNDSGYNNIELADFRTYETTYFPNANIETRTLTGDKSGYTDVDLRKISLFNKLEEEKGKQNYYTLGDHTVDHENPKTKTEGLPNKYHNLDRHIYRIPNTVLASDFVIDIAKLKTHKFAGATLLLKNIIGITQGKEYLPHRRPGTPDEGGDSFPNYPSSKYVLSIRGKKMFYKLLGNRLSLIFKRIYHVFVKEKMPHEKHSEPLWGDWFGNDTIWRSTLDLNIILQYADKKGVSPGKKRHFLGLIDGIVGMDHEGPMQGLPVKSNILIAAKNPIAGDVLGSYLMGFNPEKIKTILNSTVINDDYSIGNYNINTDEIVSNVELTECVTLFEPTKGWKKYLHKTYTEFKGFNK